MAFLASSIHSEATSRNSSPEIPKNGFWESKRVCALKLPAGDGTATVAVNNDERRERRKKDGGRLMVGVDERDNELGTAAVVFRVNLIVDHAVPVTAAQGLHYMTSSTMTHHHGHVTQVWSEFVF